MDTSLFKEMYMFKFIPILVISGSVIFANDNDGQYCQDPDREIQVREKMESGFENTAIGITEITGGAGTVVGSPISGGILIGDGLRHIKEGIKDYEEAKRIIEQDRAEHNSVETPYVEPYKYDISER